MQEWLLDSGLADGMRDPGFVLPAGVPFTWKYRGPVPAHRRHHDAGGPHQGDPARVRAAAGHRRRQHVEAGAAHLRTHRHRHRTARAGSRTVVTPTDRERTTGIARDARGDLPRADLLDRPCSRRPRRARASGSPPTPGSPAGPRCWPPCRPCRPPRSAIAAFRTAHGVAPRLPRRGDGQRHRLGRHGRCHGPGRLARLLRRGRGCCPTAVEAAIGRIAAEAPGDAVRRQPDPQPERAGARARPWSTCTCATGCACVEASAFLDLTPPVVRYRAAGLPRGRRRAVITAANRVIAKVSRVEVAERFLRPAARARCCARWSSPGTITAEQAELARRVPMADDITAEADSGGHTDNRPLSCCCPTMLRAARPDPARASATPRPVAGRRGGRHRHPGGGGRRVRDGRRLRRHRLGQPGVRRGGHLAPRSKEMLAAGRAWPTARWPPPPTCSRWASRSRCSSAARCSPCGRAQLYELYRTYDALERLPAAERAELEKQLFRRPLDDVWAGRVRLLRRARPGADRARRGTTPSTGWRWSSAGTSGMSSRWAHAGEPTRAVDYQIWCGPAMGAFNDWVRGTYLAAPAQPRVADVAHPHHAAARPSTPGARQLRGAGVAFSPRRPTTVRRPGDPGPMALLGDPAMTRAAGRAGPRCSATRATRQPVRLRRPPSTRRAGRVPDRVLRRAARAGFHLNYLPTSWGGALESFDRSLDCWYASAARRDAQHHARHHVLHHRGDLSELHGHRSSTSGRRGSSTGGGAVAFALTEAENGSDLLEQLAARLSRDGELTGAKWMVGLGRSREAVYVVARTGERGPGAFSAVLLDLGDPQGQPQRTPPRDGRNARHRHRPPALRRPPGAR